MKNDVMFSSRTDMWETPQDFFDELNSEFHFTLDVCAVPENAKCEKFYTPDDDGLSQPWDGVVWCNPPYGRDIGKWILTASIASGARGATVVMLLPARTDTRWFHDFIYQKDRVEIRFLRGRLKFGNSKNSAPFPSMVVVFRPTSYPGLTCAQQTGGGQM
nr:DNA N-6-adenine-methyltransferase [uncultured Agathobaculum sp.]